jgi:hypothetical protein
LQYATANRYKRGAEFGGNYWGLEISVLTFYNEFYVFWDVVVVEYWLDEIMMDFAESIRQIK